MDKQAVKLRRILTIRTFAVKAVGYGALGIFSGLLLMFMSEPFVEVPYLGETILTVSPIVGLLSVLAVLIGLLVLFVIQFIGCPFCNKFFFYNWWFVWIFGNNCVNCGRGIE